MERVAVGADGSPPVILTGVAAGHHLFIAGALSIAKPPERWLPFECFPIGNHQSYPVMIPYGNIRF